MQLDYLVPKVNIFPMIKFNAVVVLMEFVAQRSLEMLL